MLLVNYVWLFLSIFLWIILTVFFCKQVHHTTMHQSYTFFGFCCPKEYNLILLYFYLCFLVAIILVFPLY